VGVGVGVWVCGMWYVVCICEIKKRVSPWLNLTSNIFYFFYFLLFIFYFLYVFFNILYFIIYFCLISILLSILVKDAVVISRRQSEHITGDLFSA
jgi:hypothetical protein